MSSLGSGRPGVSWRIWLQGTAGPRRWAADTIFGLGAAVVGRLLHDRNRLLAICKWLVAIGRSADAVTIADLARRDSPYDGKLYLHLAEAAITGGDRARVEGLIDRLAVGRDGISRSAALLLEVIGTIEAPRGYEVIFRNRQDQLATPLTAMTLAEVLAAQPGWATTNGSSAAGRYQVIDRTLATISVDLALDPLARYDASLQDRIGYGLLLRRGFDRFISRDLPLPDFALELAREWAAFPVVAPVEGMHRQLEAGETYYAGDGRNRALMSPPLFVAILERCLALAPDAGNSRPAALASAGKIGDAAAAGLGSLTPSE